MRLHTVVIYVVLGVLMGVIGLSPLQTLGAIFIISIANILDNHLSS